MAVSTEKGLHAVFSVIAVINLISFPNVFCQAGDRYIGIPRQPQPKPQPQPPQEQQQPQQPQQPPPPPQQQQRQQPQPPPPQQQQPQQQHAVDEITSSESFRMFGNENNAKIENSVENIRREEISQRQTVNDWRWDITDDDNDDSNNDNESDNNDDDNGRVYGEKGRNQYGGDYNSYNVGRKTNEGNNCIYCRNEVVALKRDLMVEVEERKALKKALDTYITELYELRSHLNRNGTKLYGPASLPLTAKGFVSFSAKMSYNRELKPLDTIVFDTVLSNQGLAYDVTSGVFRAPLSGVYMFFSTILSGYNTKVESAIIVNDEEVARIYSGAHDAHGSGSNMVILNLHSNDIVWVRLLYQGGNHVHGYYSTFSGVLLSEQEG